MFLKSSNKLAIVDFDDRHISFDEMVGSVKYLSKEIFTEFREKEKVLIFAENRKEWIYTFYSIWDKKATAVCVDALSSELEMEYFINDCKPCAIVVTNNTVDIVRNIQEKNNLDIKIYNLDEIEIQEIKDDRVLDTPDEKELALMVYTSGTTGSPKGVMLSMYNLLSEIEVLNDIIDLSSKDQILAILPFHHILPLMSTCLYSFYNEMSIVLVEKLTSQEILKKLNENNITVLVGVPRVCKLFYKSIKDKIESKFITSLLYKIVKKVNNKKFAKKVFKKVHDLFGGNMRYFIIGGAKSEPEMVEFFETLGFSYCEGYGLSETATVVAGSVRPNYKVGTVGRPALNVEIKTVNGELWVKGPMVMMGYYNKPEKTAEVITEDGWFKTGDLVEIDDEGYITILGRANSMIVLSNGKNIDPEKLENRVMNISDNIISEIGIFGKNDKLSAVVVPNKGIANVSTHIRDIIQIYNKDAHNYEKILDYKIVDEELPKTRIGKLRRFKLAEVFGGKVEKKVIENEPTTKEYEILKKYLTKLKNTNIGPDENFEIEAGLDSLDQVEFITYIENSFSIKMDENLLTNYPNLRLLSEYIQKTSSEFNEKEIKLDMIIKNAPYEELHDSKLQNLLRPIMYILFKIYFRLKINGKEKISNKPTIFIANHESFVDAPILSLALPTRVQNRTYYLGLEKYFENSIMKFVAKHSNLITIDIGKDIKLSLEKIANALKQEKNVFIFPEGSRTKDGTLGEFKKVFAIISKELNVDIQCIGINGAFEAYSRFSKFPKPKKIEVDVLETVTSDGKTYEEIVDECFNIFEKYKENKKK